MMTPSRQQARCHFCGVELDIRVVGIYQRASSWLEQRGATGGANAVGLAERENTWACGPCIDATGWPRSLDPKHPAAPRSTPHDMRHPAATWMLVQKKLLPTDASLYLGHASVEFTVRRYVEPRGDVFERGTDSMEES